MSLVMLAQAVMQQSDPNRLSDTIGWGAGSVTVVFLLKSVFEFVQARDEKRQRQTMCDNLICQTQLLKELHGTSQSQMEKYQVMSERLTTAVTQQFTAVEAEKHKNAIIAAVACKFRNQP